MREDSPRWEEINPSQYPHEREGLRELASYLPDTEPFHVWANVEFVGADGSINEMDALVLTRGGLYVLELKHWQGTVGGDGSHWVQRVGRGRLTPYDNPVILTNRKARRLASLMRHYARQSGRENLVPFIGATVFMHARGMRSELDTIGRQHVYGLDRHPSGLPSLKEMLLAVPRDPGRLIDGARGRAIVDLVRSAKIRPSVANRKVGDNLLLFPNAYAEGTGWQDFLAGHVMDRSLVRRVRFYLTGSASSDELPAIKRAAEREFRLLQGIHHPGIARALDMHDHKYGPAIVFDHDPDAMRLDQWLAQRDQSLTLAQRLTLVQNLAEILDHAHSRRLAHRALNPRAIMVVKPDSPSPELVVNDWQTGGRMATATHLTRLGSTTGGAGLEILFDDETRVYQAPEAARLDNLPGPQLDVFSLGAIAYRVFARIPPAPSPEELCAAVQGGGLNLAGAVDNLPNALIELVYDATRGEPGTRIPTVAEFRKRLEHVWEELTAPEPEPVIDPLEAHKGDLLDGGLTVARRLGSGATAVALLVTRSGAETSKRQLVLKVARDESHTERFAAERETISRLNSSWVAACIKDGPTVIGGRAVLLLESAGERTLAEELREGRLAFDLLKRYGRDLMDIVVYLDGQGVWHRDLKPANLAARPRPRDRELHLCVFDFSLAATPADQLAAGTPPYLDPFLGPPRRLRYDSAAERFAAAVTLYEMATGELPRWGENANPAAVSDEVTLDPSAFEPAIADRMVTFFARALARDSGQRFDTAEDMSDAWRTIFVDVPTVAAVTVPERLTRESPLTATGLTLGSQSALSRLGVHTVGELLDYEPSALTRARGVPDATRREIRNAIKGLRDQVDGPGSRSDAEEPADRPAVGVDIVCSKLLPATVKGRDRDALRVLLGQQPGDDGSFLRWPSQSDAARATGVAQPHLSTLLRRRARLWLDNASLELVRQEIVTLLRGRGGVMSADELAEALVVARGSYAPEPKRHAQAVGLVRAAVEAELARGGDARLAIRQLRGTDVVLVGLEPDDPGLEITAADLLAYAARLGRKAAELVRQDPLPTRQRAMEELRGIEARQGIPPVSDQRLLPLAVAASGNVADVNQLGQLYPVGMPAERALRMAEVGLARQRHGEDQLRARVLARFPKAESLPLRPELDALVAMSGLGVIWDHAAEAYVPRGTGAPIYSTRPAPDPDLPSPQVAEAQEKLTSVIAQRGYLVVLARIRQLVEARRALLGRFRLAEVDVTKILLERLRAQGFPWEVVVAADTGAPDDPDFRGLVDIVHQEVVPAVQAALAIEQPVLITEAAPLARYGQMRLLQELADPTRPRPGARLLLVPARRQDPVLLDTTQVPLTSRGAQSMTLPPEWLTPRVSLAG